MGALPIRTVVIGMRLRDPRCVNFLPTRISVAIAVIAQVHANHSQFPARFRRHEWCIHSIRSVAGIATPGDSSGHRLTDQPYRESPGQCSEFRRLTVGQRDPRWSVSACVRPEPAARWLVSWSLVTS